MKIILTISFLFFFQFNCFTQGQSAVLFDTADCSKSVRVAYSEQYVVHLNADSSRSKFLSRKRFYSKGMLTKLIIYDASGIIQVVYDYLYNRNGNILSVRKSDFIGYTTVYLLENAYNEQSKIQSIKILKEGSEKEIYSSLYLYLSIS